MFTSPLLAALLLAASPTAEPMARPVLLEPPPAVASLRALAARPGLSADALLAGLDGAYLAPRADRSRENDPLYAMLHRQDVRAWLRAVNAIEFRFVDEFPADPRAGEVLSWAVITTTLDAERQRDAAGTVAARRAFIDSLRPRFAGHPKLQSSLSAMELYYQYHFGDMGQDQLVAAADRLRGDDPQNPTVADLLFAAAGKADGQDKQMLLRKLRDEYADTGGGRQALAALRQQAGPGRPFAFDFADAVSGRRVTSGQMLGKIIVVDFWATWCGPCVAATPALKSLYGRFHDKGVEFVGVSLDLPAASGGRDNLLAYVKEHDLPWPQWYQGQDWDSPFSQQWVAEGIPTFVVVGRDGRTVATEVGDEGVAKLEAILTTLIAAPTTRPTTRPATRAFFDHPTTRPAALLVEAFDALKMDDFDATRAGDLQAYQDAYYAEWDRRQAEQAAIAKVVINLYPDTPRLADLIRERLNWLGWADERGPRNVLDEIAAMRARGIGADETKPTSWNLAFFEGESLLRLESPRVDEAEKVATRLADLTAAGPNDLAPPLLSHVARARGDAGDAAGETRLLDEIVRRFPDSAYGLAIAEQRARDAMIGTPFGFAFTDFATGEKIDTRDWKGHPVVIDFWATWCGPCIADLPAMMKAYENFSRRGVKFVGVSFDEPRGKGGDAELRRFLANQPMPWPQYYLLGDATQRPTTLPAGQVDNGAWDTPLIKRANVGGIPSVFVLDAEGNLRFVTRGDDVAAKLEELLK